MDPESSTHVQNAIRFHTDCMQSLYEQNLETPIVCGKCPATSPTLSLGVLQSHLMTMHLMNCVHKCIFCFATVQWKPRKRGRHSWHASYLAFVKHRHECLRNLLLANASNSDPPPPIARREEAACRPALRAQLQTDASVFFSLGKRKTWDGGCGVPPTDAKFIRLQTLDTKWKFHRHVSQSAMKEWPSFRTQTTPVQSPEQSAAATTPPPLDPCASEECRRLRKQLHDTYEALQDARQQLLSIQDLLQDIQQNDIESSTPTCRIWRQLLTSERVSSARQPPHSQDCAPPECSQVRTPSPTTSTTDLGSPHLCIEPWEVDREDYLGPALCIDMMM